MVKETHNDASEIAVETTSSPEQEDLTGLRFLKEKYNLHTAPEVEKAVRKKEASGVRIEDKPLPRIQAYLNRLSNVLNPPERESFDRRERNLRLLKGSLHRHFIIMPENIPQSYWAERRISAPEQKEREAGVVIADQEATLDLWSDYLFSDEINYPLWLRYYALRSILGMGNYDKESRTFSKRDKGTVAPFPDLNSEALVMVLDAIKNRGSKEWEKLDQEVRRFSNEQKRFAGQARRLEKQTKLTEAGEAKLQAEEAQWQVDLLIEKQKQLFRFISSIPAEHQDELLHLLQESNFDQLYAWALGELSRNREADLQVTDGEWVIYKQGSDPSPLVRSLRGRDTGWSTVGESTAQKYLAEGDMYVFYSLDSSGKPTIPRVSIKMKGTTIHQVRGIAGGQNLDLYVADVVRKKLREFPDAESLEKRLLDTDKLTRLEQRMKGEEPLDRQELVFLYEIESPIEGFGYQRDHRIVELRSQRNQEADILTIFECEKNQVAYDPAEIRQGTRVYIGPLTPGLFEKIETFGIQYTYISFPERRIQRDALTIGGKTKEMLERELREQGITISLAAERMLHNEDFVARNGLETVNTVLLSVADLGFDKDPNVDQIYDRARKLGLERCPPEVAIYRRLQDRKQPTGSWYIVAMKRLEVSESDSRVFRLLRTGSTLQLHDYYSYPTDTYPLSTRILFRRIAHKLSK